MPLFMDYHKGLTVTIEDVKNAHIADEAVQSKYGVVYHQFWVNEENGTVFCLMEGPDEEACAAVHREAHGEVACSIVEVSTGFYELLMGSKHIVEQGHVKHSDGTPDKGIRNILVLNIQGITSAKKSSDYSLLRIPFPAKEFALSHIARFGGREVTWLHDGSLVTVFDSGQQAVECAADLQSELLRRRNVSENNGWNISFKMGLCAGQPLTERGDLFSDAIVLARRLCSVASENQLIVAPGMQELFNATRFRASNIRMLTQREQDFISSLFTISEEKLSDDSFTVDSLSRNIGMSRPQLYRKVISLTGKSPNDFLRDLRMDKALSLIKKKSGNISEIALEVGYNNPSYFARCFQIKYGCTPSRLVN